MSESSRRHRSAPAPARRKRTAARRSPKLQRGIQDDLLQGACLQEVDPPQARTSPEQKGVREQQLELAVPGGPPASNVEAQPFLKWAGGKAQLLAQLDRFLPAHIERYFEPFVGGGAVFFHLKQRFPGLRAFLRDNNAELMNAYVAVRDFPMELMRQLDAHLPRYHAERKNYFYLVRNQHHLPSGKIVERAARMIFLNKTCFNGLWRVNAHGEFNVPIGSHSKPTLYDRANLLAASAALRGVDLATRDFRDTIDEACRGDFVYLDPPYVPLSATASFTSYTKEDFGPEEQRELAGLCADLARRGVRFMLSNSDTDLVRHFYRNFTIHRVRARRAINCDGAKRGQIDEVVVVN